MIMNTVKTLLYHKVQNLANLFLPFTCGLLFAQSWLTRQEIRRKKIRSMRECENKLASLNIILSAPKLTNLLRFFFQISRLFQRFI